MSNLRSVLSAVQLLHCGDVHFPESKSPQVDLKDTGAPKDWNTHFALKPLQEVVQSAANFRNNAAGLLLSGDLTSKSDMGAYAECLAYLSSAFQFGDHEFWQERFIRVVPGNHDVDRGAATVDDPFVRFAPIEKAWKELGFSFLTTRDVDASGTADQLGIEVFSVNSCMGCGDVRHFPTKLQSKLAELLADPNAVDFDDLVESLDTPAILAEHLDDLETRINQLPEKTVPVVLAHHSILPQVTPRIALYTELLNAGYVRARLSSLNRTVVYCHGHVHSDPVETVTQPQHPRGGLVMIAAPILTRGFNVLRVERNRCGQPLGLVIEPHRRQDHGGIRRQTALRVSLCLGNRISLPKETAIALEETSPTWQRFSEILESVRAATGRQTQEKTVQNALLELEWMGQIEVANRDEESKHWQIRRCMPHE